MSIDIGMAAASVKSAEPYSGYTGVKLVYGEENKELLVGSTSGQVMTVECPMATDGTARDIANKTLAKISGYQYQPMKAQSAVIDPAAELGDSITAAGVQSRMFSQDIRFGGSMRSDIEAPSEEEIDHEFSFSPARQRKVDRAIGGFSRGFAEISEFDEHGRRVLSQEGLSAYVLDDDGKFKASTLSLSVVEYENGKTISLADLAGDYIMLKGHVQIVSDGESATALQVVGGRLSSYAGQAFFGDSTFLGASQTQINSLNVLVPGTQSYPRFQPRTVYVVTGNVAPYIDTNPSGGVAITTPGGTKYFHPGGVTTTPVTVLAIV